MAKEPRSSWSKNKNISVEFPSGKFLPLSQMRNNINLKKFKSLRNATYPEQQLPGVPHELGVPQQLPEPGSGNLRDELLDVLWADSSLVKSSPPHCLQCTCSCFVRIRNSFN